MEEVDEKRSIAVYLAAYSRLRDSHLAEDVAQEVFVKAWYNFNKLQDSSKFSSWLLSITRNTAIDFARKERLDVGLEDVRISSRSEFYGRNIFARGTEKSRLESDWRAG